MTDDPETLLRGAFARQQARNRKMLERITDRHVARTMHTGAGVEPELTAAELLAAAVADNQEGTEHDD